MKEGENVLRVSRTLIVAKAGLTMLLARTWMTAIGAMFSSVSGRVSSYQQDRGENQIFENELTR